MEDSNPNKINIDDEDEEEEISTTYCPYKKVTNFFGGFFGGEKKQSNSKNDSNEMPKLSNEDIEKPKCPFGFTSTSTSNKKKVPKGRCPFGFGAQEDDNKDIHNIKQENRNIKKENEKNASDDEDSGDEQPMGGCPVMGKGRLDPKNKDFEEFYEIPCFGNYDFMFF